ncbi:MAG: hypothetical protein ACLR56_03110 [Oscillospiraceae bacterium]
MWDWIKLSPEDLKRVYDDTVVESGADVLFNQPFALPKRKTEELNKFTLLIKAD